MKSNMFSEDQLELLRTGFQTHDFTQSIALNPEYENMSPEQLKAFTALKKRVLGYMQSNLPVLDIPRPPRNFAGDHPVNLLMDADASYIAEEAAEILEDREKTEAAVEQYFEMFDPLADQALNSYCEAKNRNPDELTEKELQYIADRVTQVVNETLLEAVMQGQQFTQVNAIAHQYQAHEDFGDKRSPDAINFHNQWTHAKTKIGEMLSLEGLDESVPAGANTDADYRLLRDSFCSTLNDTETSILYLLEDGKTQREIAAALGYKTHSPVSKRISAMREKFDAFLRDDNA